jgi:hypothetical protein
MINLFRCFDCEPWPQRGQAIEWLAPPARCPRIVRGVYRGGFTFIPDGAAKGEFAEYAPLAWRPVQTPAQVPA